MHHRFTQIASAALIAAGLVACGGDDDEAPAAAPAAPVAVGDTVALTATGRLVSFNRATPATLVGGIAISGLAGGETLLGIDVRPADGLLYAVSSAGLIYTVLPSTGVATLKATLAADSIDTTAPFTALAGTTFSVDFNPAANRLRVVSDTGQSLRIVVETVAGTGAVTAGWTITDLDINRVATPASVVAAAYTSNFAGATTTTLLDIETNSNVLSLQNPLNAGTLVDVGSLGLDVQGTAGPTQ